MDVLWSNLTPQDWVVLGLIAMVPALMAVAIYLIRREVRQAAQHGPAEPPRSTLPPRLKTTAAQREQWRRGKQRHPRAIADLADDIETLLKRGGVGS